MAKIIEVNKNVSSKELEKELTKIQNQKKPIDLKKYVGKIDFGIDGLTYQLETRNEWK
ncbi:MAG: hypothetical protein IE931_07200 [Sphingobacteriales bacterium]|nr:hypothetical protein [Sphingobacteriales bacterium]